MADNPRSISRSRPGAADDIDAGKEGNSDSRNGDDSPVKRRRRVRLACQACRDRKIRCDGGTPVCETCRRKNLDSEHCVYPAVEGNLRLSSNIRNKRRQMTRSEPGATNTFKDATDDPAPTAASGDVTERVVSYTPRTSATQQHPQRNQVREEASRALNDTSSWAQQQYEDISPAINGSASSVNLVEPVYDPLQHTSNHDVHTIRPPSIVYDTRAPINTARSTKLLDTNTIGHFLADLSLPPKPLVDRFLELYWNDIHPQSPLFHEQTFMKKYDRFWLEGLTPHQPFAGGSLMENGISSSDKIFFATINLILALVQQRTTTTETRRNNPPSEEVFYNRADRLLAPDLLDLESIDLVQALILKAAYLREADMTYRAWIAAGTAIRAAQAVGLYADYTGGSQVEKEERRRIWYTCVLMDRVQSMTYARPTMISEPLSLPYPTVIDDEYMSLNPDEPDGTQPIGVPSRMAYFQATLKLSDIRHQIRQSLKSQAASDMSLDIKKYSAMIEFDDDIGRWYEEVPSYLRLSRPETESPSGTCFSRQSNYLRCQFFHLRIALCRPLIVDFARNESSRPHTSLQQVLCQGCVETCIRAAQDLLNTIEPNIGTNLLPPGWYITSYYLYSAGAVMAIVLLTPALQEVCKNVTLEELQQAWTQCLNCFAKYDRQGVRFARNCIIGLRKMFAEDHGAATATKNGSHPHMLSGVPGSLRTNSEQQVASATIPTNIYPSISARNAIDDVDQEDTEPWWMNEDFHLLNSFETFDDYGSVAELNELWGFME